MNDCSRYVGGVVSRAEEASCHVRVPHVSLANVNNNPSTFPFSSRDLVQRGFPHRESLSLTRIPFERWCRLRDAAESAHRSLLFE